MLFSLPVLGCVLACLSLLAPAHGLDLRIIKVTSAKSADGKTATLTAEFEAGQEPEAVWFSRDSERKKLSGGNLNYDTTTKKGQATMSVKIADFMYTQLNLNLGLLDSHVFSMYWRVEAGDASQTVDLTPSTVTPGTDLAYAQGTVVEAEIAVRHDQGNNVTFFDHWVQVYGYFLDEQTGMVQNSDVDASNMNVTWDTQGQITTTRVQFLTERFTVNGLFKALLFGFLPQDSPVSWIEEVIYLVVHEDTNDGPFPNDFVSVTGEGYNGYSFYYLYCDAYANDLESMDIFQRKNGNNVPVPSAKADTFFDDNTIHAEATLDKATAKGEYVCSANRKGNSVPTEYVINVP